MTPQFIRIQEYRFNLNLISRYTAYQDQSSKDLWIYIQYSDSDNKFRFKEHEKTEWERIVLELDSYLVNNTFTISQKEYEKLLKDSEFLGYLRMCGVDNWEGYDEARRMIRVDE